MNYDLTILIPSIRPSRLPALYDSLKLACKQYNWQLLLIGPFDPPAEIAPLYNVKYIKDYGNVVRCVQRAVPECDAPLFFLTVDDCTFQENSIDDAMSMYSELCSERDVIAVRYGEGGDKQPEHYWTTAFHGDLRKPGISPAWKIANQPLMRVSRFIELGGLDCAIGFEYLDKPIHDFMFRLQLDGGSIFISRQHACIATWWPDEKFDHGPVHHAQVSNDGTIFNMIYSLPVGARQIHMNYDDWKSIPEVWTRRFGANLPTSYKEMCEQQGYEYLPENG